MSRSVLVTGTSGRVGRRVAEFLTASGSAVVGVDLRPGPFTQLVGDLTTIEISKAVAPCHTVIHCAALHAPHLGEHDDSEFVAANVMATDRLVETARRVGVERFVFTSTTSVYGHALDDSDAAVWVSEDLRPLPRDVYDATKLHAEQIVKDAHDRAFSTITLRLARCFPEGHRETVVNRLYRGLDIRDAVQGILAAAEAHGQDHEVLNIAGPRVFEITDSQRLRSDASAVIAERVPWLPREFALRNWALPQHIDRVYVSDRAATAIGYRPAHGLRSALDRHEPTAETATIRTAC